MESCEKSTLSEKAQRDETLTKTLEAEVPVQVEKENEKESATTYSGLSKSELVAQLETQLENPIDGMKERVIAIKHAFYAIRKLEMDAEKAAFVERGNEESAFAPKEDSEEERFKELLLQYKEIKAKQQEALECALQENLAKRKEVLSELSKITEDPDNINKQYTNFQRLQQEFKDGGDVPPSEEKQLWKEFQTVTEKFYDLWKINKELRDYDFKKNLEAKEVLCDEAEALSAEKDILSAFKKLQVLHDEWRTVGPVVKELRESLWKRFKEASTVVNKRHQAYFEERKAKENENEIAKIAICEEAESVDTAKLTSYSKWDEATKVIIGLQDRWKTLGFASKKVNNDLFVRFRGVCDEFFAKKAAFFKRMKEESAANLAKKHQLCERAEALKDSTDWKKTAEELTALQKEWKTIGPVAKKSGDAVWKRFIAACDYFFENKGKNMTNTRQEEHFNLKAKKAVIEKIKTISDTLQKEEIRKMLKELSQEFQGIGHVPFKDKDKIYEEYKQALNAAYSKYGIDEARTRMEHFATTLEELSSDKSKLYRERERLVRLYEQKSAEVKTFENNLGFFNVTSKAGGSVLKEMERRVQKAKEELTTLEKKIELIDDKF